MTAIFVATLAVSLFSMPVMAPIGGNNSVFVNPPESGPLNPGDSFTVDVVAVRSSGAANVRAWEFVLTWNPAMLRIDANAPVTEGLFLASSGAQTFMAQSPGIAGNSIDVADLIVPVSWATLTNTPQVMATVSFTVIAGGQCDLGLTASLYDPNFAALPVASVTGGHFWSATPFIDFAWYIPTPIPTSSVNVSGIGLELFTDSSGNTASRSTTPYTALRPVAAVDPLTGRVISYNLVKGGTMFYGDSIMFDASGSYVVTQQLNGTLVQSPLPDSAFHWLIRAGGVNTLKGQNARYETGVTPGFGVGPTFSYTFPGAYPWLYSDYGTYHLGFHDLNLTVTYGGFSVNYYTFIRIFRLSPAEMKSVNIPNKHVSVGDTMLIGGKVQNRGGTNLWPWYVLEGTYVSLGRMINGFVWATVQFTITNAAGNKVATLYSDEMYLGQTELPTSPVYVSWKVPNLAPGRYTVTAKAFFCGTGIGNGMAAIGSTSSWFIVG